MRKWQHRGVPTRGVARGLLMAVLAVVVAPAPSGASPVAFVLSKALLRYDDFAGPGRDKGKFSIRAIVDDTDGTLPADLVAGVVQVRVVDAGTFDATVTLTNCVVSGSQERIRCRDNTTGVKARFLPTNQGPFIYNMTISARFLSEAATGSAQPVGPEVSVTLDATMDTIGDVEPCEQKGDKKLLCRER